MQTIILEEIKKATKNLLPIKQLLENGYSIEAKDGGAIHCYTTADNAFIFARLRLKNPTTGQKEIRPIHQEASDAWTIKAPAFDNGTPLYNLHQLCESERKIEQVILVEGEWCADMLAMRGILATTSGGAQSVDKANWQPLAGRNILIWADNDKAGFCYAQHAAEKLRALSCVVSFINVEVLNLPPKGDCVDWLKVFYQQHARKALAADIWALPTLASLPDIATPPSKNTTYSGKALTQSDSETIEHLASLDLVEYDRARKEQAKALNVSLPTLDKKVKTIRSEKSKTNRLPFYEVDPHSETINPTQLLNEISDTIQRFIILDIEQAHALTLWVTLTWFIDVVEIAPLAIINAPEKACGKTQLLTLLGHISYRPLPASNASASALFRAVELWNPTILIDEADTFFRDNSELHGMVNAGYARGSFILRSEVAGDSFEPRSFAVFSAKALAGISLEKHLPDATMSRGIVFNLRRKLSHELVDRLRHDGKNLFVEIAKKLARFKLDYSEKVKEIRPALPDVLGDRDQDNWDGLFAIASCAGEEWLAHAKAAALKLSYAGEKVVSTGNELLVDIQQIFERKQINKIKTADLIAELCIDEEAPWATYNNRTKPITPRQVSRLLKAYGINSKSIRLSSYETPKGFELSQFEDAFKRYLFPIENLPQHGNKPSEANIQAVSSVADNPPQKTMRIHSETSEPLPILGCGGVADKTTFSGDIKDNPLHLRI